MSKLIPYALLLFFGICWGTSIPLAKVAVSTGHHPFGMIFWQIVISIVLLSGIAFVRKSKLIFDAPHIIFFAVVILVGTIVPNGFSYFAAFHLPAGVMALVIAMVPVFSILIALTIGAEKFDLKRLAGVVLGITAIALLVLPESSLPDPAKAIFVLVALIAPFAYGAEGNYLAAKQPADTGPIATLLGASIVGFFISFALTWSVDGFIDPTVSFGKPELALVGSSVLHIIAYVGYIGLVSRAGAVFTSQVAYIVTPAGVVLSSLFLGEVHSAWLWASLAIMIFALFLVQPRANEEEAAKAETDTKAVAG